MERNILLVRVSGVVYAIDGICPGDGGNLADGVIHGNLIRCPIHGSEFDLRTGRAIKGPWDDPNKVHDLRSYPVKEDSECIYMEFKDLQ